MKTVREVIKRLPELPLETFEVAGKLDYGDTGPFLTIRPHEFPTPKKPPTTLPLAPKSEFSIRDYFVQVLYPRVVCTDPGGILGGGVIKADLAKLQNPGGPPAGPRPDRIALAKHERHYKLSSFRGAKLQLPLWCTVKHGPWLAAVRETESCITGEPNFWVLSIVEIPQVTLTWYGLWTDIPAYPNLTVIMGDLSLAAQTSQCCGGFQFCATTQSCIPIQVPCKDNVPA